MKERLKWSTNRDAVHETGLSRLYFVRMLRSFNMCSKMLESLPGCGSECHLLCCCLLGASISARDASRVSKRMHKPGTIFRQNLEVLRNKRSVNKPLSIMDHSTSAPQCRGSRAHSSSDYFTFKRRTSWSSVNVHNSFLFWNR